MSALCQYPEHHTCPLTPALHCRPAPKRQKVAGGRRRSTVAGEGGRGAVGTQRADGGAYSLVVNYMGW
jgi:hypothetical protein